MTLSGPRSVVVTGGAGFVGSHVVDRLLAHGLRVTVIDSFEPFYPRSMKEANLANARESTRFHLLEGDTRHRDTLVQAIVAAKPDVVVDFAARAGVRPSLVDPDLYVAINVVGFQHTLLAAAMVGARFVFASSSSVYGNDPRQPFQEDQVGLRPESPYAATKVAGEALVHAHHVSSGLPVAVARLFTVYGPRQRPDLAIRHFATRMLRGEAVELFDHGRAVRDYTYVDDIAEGFVRLIAAEDPWLTVNLGSHRPISTSAVVDELERALGVNARRVLRPPRKGDVPATYADIARAGERLDWHPSVDFEEGIARFCEWLRGPEGRVPPAQA